MIYNRVYHFRFNNKKYPNNEYFVKFYMLIKSISSFSCTWWANACDSVGVRQTWVQASSVNDFSDFSLANFLIYGPISGAWQAKRNRDLGLNLLALTVPVGCIWFSLLAPPLPAFSLSLGCLPQPSRLTRPAELLILCTTLCQVHYLCVPPTCGL